jgi:Arc/MetJ-type ribon-helix-helix transcriptional regulator
MMTKDTGEPKAVESTPEKASFHSDWEVAFEEAVKAAREAFNASAAATAELLRHGGKLVGQTMGEAQRTLVITLDEETISSLDKMVSAGVHKNRGDAIRFLLNRGMEASGDLLARIDKVEKRIDALRTKMREIPLEDTEE